jgi:hypothetical protein
MDVSRRPDRGWNFAPYPQSRRLYQPIRPQFGSSSHCRIACGIWNEHGQWLYKRSWNLRSEPPVFAVACRNLDLYTLWISDCAIRALLRWGFHMSSAFARRNAVAFFVGVLFALGLAISGMTQPQKIIGFLNPWEWDPSLLFVMIGAVGIHILTYPLVRRRPTPLLDTKWHVPTRNDVTVRLILGSALFGVGWGLGGYCPGPGVTALASGDFRAFAFVGAMTLGILLFKKTEPYLQLRK